MTTAAPVTVNEVEVFRHQARMIQAVIRMNVEGVTQEESLLQPSPGGNCLNWVVGHLACIYNNVLPLLGQEPVEDGAALKRYDRGAPPIRDAAEALELRDLLAAFDKATERFDAGLAGLSPEVLDRKAPFSPGNNPNETVRTLLTTVVFHQAYHAGQTGILRRIAGKEGAIR
ncbi:MAG: DinB family protein [Thermoanaerobaculia bacterium]